MLTLRFKIVNDALTFPLSKDYLFYRQAIIYEKIMLEQHMVWRDQPLERLKRDISCDNGPFNVNINLHRSLNIFSQFRV